WARLPTDELRTAFVADKQSPYTALVRLCLASPDRNRIAEALSYVERARSRAPVDLMGGALELRHIPRDRFEAELAARLEELAEELNWFYSQLARQVDAEPGQSPAATETLQTAARQRERAMAEISRQLQQKGALRSARVEPADIAALQQKLG